MNKVLCHSQCYNPNLDYDRHNQEVSITVSKESDGIENNNSIGETSNAFSELCDEEEEFFVSKSESCIMRDINQSKAYIQPISNTEDVQNMIDRKVVTVEGNDNINLSLLCNSMEACSSSDVNVAQGQDRKPQGVAMTDIEENKINRRSICTLESNIINTGSIIENWKPNREKSKVVDSPHSTNSNHKHKTTELLRDFHPLPPPISIDVTNQPTNNIKNLFTSFKGGGFRKRKHNFNEAITDKNLRKQTIFPILTKRENVNKNSGSLNKDRGPHLNPNIGLDDIFKVSPSKSADKNNRGELLKDFPPSFPLSPTIVTNESINTTNYKETARRKAEVGRVKNFLSSVRTLTSRNSNITTSTAKDSDHSSNNMKPTRTSILPSIGSKCSSGHSSKLQEARWKQDDLVHDALNRHRCLTGDQFECKFKTGNPECPSRQNSSNIWKKVIESSSDSSLSCHEDVVSVETSLSEITMESGNMWPRIRVGEVKVICVIPDVICLKKSRRGFFGRKKLWRKKCNNT